MAAAALRVAVLGPGAEATPEICALAGDVGRLLAERGAVVLTGGLGGVMAAAAEGATSAGGAAVGLLPGTDRAAGNEYSTISIPTGLGEMRNALLIECADGIVSVGGSWGTLSEIALARRADVPVVSLAGWSVLAADGCPLPLVTAASPDAAVRSVLELIATRPGPEPGRMDR
ncbi:MAG: TIGR00725 family protein [Pseudonocardiales bacterium]|nr:MAG: TIGR00725 family protein [Pseudonocardiales bacterium]